uniref:Cytochrome c oxidase subunit 2 n=1 Tax=Pleuropoma jana TaxID=1882665 RepID=A0A1B2G396_9GAST|nr:cytochrome c oxidase subunit II [Pleuropoma jana]
MAPWGQLMFQDAASPIMEELIFFHDNAMTILALISTLVMYIYFCLMSSSYISRYLLAAQYLEGIWTLIPGVILIFLALPSLHMLYLLDELHSGDLTIKVVGHQWYWSYEYDDLNSVEFDSYMLPESELNFGDYRLLEVDNRIVVPVNTSVRLLITSTDVIHSWTVPMLGVKIDAVPGRLNQLSIFSKIPGVFYGQCSEICGANHSFMPIVVEVVSVNMFFSWMKVLIN